MAAGKAPAAHLARAPSMEDKIAIAGILFPAPLALGMRISLREIVFSGARFSNFSPAGLKSWGSGAAGSNGRIPVRQLGRPRSPTDDFLGRALKEIAKYFGNFPSAGNAHFP